MLFGLAGLDALGFVAVVALAVISGLTAFALGASFFDSACRHLDDYLEGKDDEDHLAAAFWNIQGLIHTEEMIKRGLLPKSLNDLRTYIKDKKRC